MQTVASHTFNLTVVKAARPYYFMHFTELIDTYIVSISDKYAIEVDKRYGDVNDALVYAVLM